MYSYSYIYTNTSKIGSINFSNFVHRVKSEDILEEQPITHLEENLSENETDETAMPHTKVEETEPEITTETEIETEENVVADNNVEEEVETEEKIETEEQTSPTNISENETKNRDEITSGYFCHNVDFSGGSMEDPGYASGDPLNNNDILHLLDLNLTSSTNETYTLHPNSSEILPYDTYEASFPGNSFLDYSFAYNTCGSPLVHTLTTTSCYIGYTYNESGLIFTDNLNNVGSYVDIYFPEIGKRYSEGIPSYSNETSWTVRYHYNGTTYVANEEPICTEISPFAKECVYFAGRCSDSSWDDLEKKCSINKTILPKTDPTVYGLLVKKYPIQTEDDYYDMSLFNFPGYQPKNWGLIGVSVDLAVNKDSLYPVPYRRGTLSISLNLLGILGIPLTNIFHYQAINDHPNFEVLGCKQKGTTAPITKEQIQIDIYTSAPEVECYYKPKYSPILKISTANDAPVKGLQVGDEVTFTTTITLPPQTYRITDTKLQDKLPNGLQYKSGSVNVISSIRGELNIEEPEYSEGEYAEWELGQILPEETVTISYKAVIKEDADIGLSVGELFVEYFSVLGNKVLGINSVGMNILPTEVTILPKSIDTVNPSDNNSPVQIVQSIYKIEKQLPKTGATTYILLLGILLTAFGIRVLTIKKENIQL